MCRQIRIIRKNSLYEIVPRAREGLPLPPTETTNQLLTGILARAQRDEKVTFCNFVEMVNHTHQLVIPDDPNQHVKFYMEYQKKVTDTVRKLTKRKRLNLWEERPSVPQIGDLEDAINRHIYIFCNPGKAGLVESIDEYPGLSSWSAFKTCEASVDAEVRIKAFWTPASVLEPLPDGDRLSPIADKLMAKEMREVEGTVECELILKPLAWLGVYGVTDPERIEKIRQKIIKEVYAQEAKFSKERIENQRPVLGATRLRQQKYLKPHTPKKRGRRIFVICANNERRPKMIASQKEVATRHRECFELRKQGLPHEWPPGTFIPWAPPKQCHPAFDLGYC
jgi:hypothetical protein